MSLSGICVEAGSVQEHTQPAPHENAVDGGGGDEDGRLRAVVRPHSGVSRVNGDAVLLERKQAGPTELATNLSTAHIVDLLETREMSHAGTQGGSRQQRCDVVRTEAKAVTMYAHGLEDRDEQGDEHRVEHRVGENDAPKVARTIDPRTDGRRIPSHPSESWLSLWHVSQSRPVMVLAPMRGSARQPADSVHADDVMVATERRAALVASSMPNRRPRMLNSSMFLPLVDASPAMGWNRMERNMAAPSPSFSVSNR